MNIKRRFVVLAACIFMGCSPLAPRPNYTQFFILTPIAGAADPLTTTALTNHGSKLAIGVGPIDFPGYLRRSQVVTLGASNRIDLSKQARWAEPLDRNFSRVLAENLSQLLKTQRIERYPWPRRTQVDYQVAVDVQNFETTAGGQAQLNARWIIKDGRSGEDLYSSETRASAPAGTGDTEASEALSNDLATLSRDIASRIIELSRHRPLATAAIKTSRPRSR